METFVRLTENPEADESDTTLLHFRPEFMDWYDLPSADKSLPCDREGLKTTLVKYCDPRSKPDGRKKTGLSETKGTRDEIRARDSARNI